jgi:hypothetical protein
MQMKLTKALTSALILEINITLPFSKKGMNMLNPKTMMKKDKNSKIATRKRSLLYSHNLEVVTPSTRSTTSY